MRQHLTNVQEILAAKNYGPKANIICLTSFSAPFHTSATHELNCGEFIAINVSSWRDNKKAQCYRQRHKENMSQQESSLF